MLTINVSVGTQTQGIQLDSDLVSQLMGSLSDEEKANASIELIKTALAIYAAANQNVPLNTAFDVVEQFSTIQT